MSKRSIMLTDSLYEYMNAVSLREPPLLLALREETASLTQRSMQISPEQGQFMALVVRLIGARQVSRGRCVHRLFVARNGSRACPTKVASSHAT